MRRWDSVMREEKESLGGLAAAVMETTRSPRDSYEVAALLESMGWTDDQARAAFGQENVFELARDVLDVCKARVATRPVVREIRLSFLVKIWNIVANYVRGTMFAMPMAVSIFAMLTVRYSLWSYLYFSVEIATSIALGTFLSFLVAGGFTQAIARRGLIYIGQKEYELAKRFTFMMIRIGLGAMVLVGIGVLLFNFAFAIFPLRMVFYALVYFVFLTLTWLTITMLYMLSRQLIFTGITIVGIAIVYLLHEVLRLNIMVSQMIALSIVGALTIWSVLFLLRQRGPRTPEGDGLAPVPRLSLVVYTVVPYFLYGVLYFTFLYVDRIMAWSANSLFMPYFIWFRGEYELGLDWALLTLILPMGMVEVFINSFWLNLNTRQKATSADTIASFNRVYVLTYRRQLIYYTAAAAASGFLIYFGMKFVGSLKLLDLHIFDNPVTFTVFLWGVVGYALMAAGLLNALYLFSLSQPEPVVRAMGYSVGVNLFLGFVLSRELDYYWAVFGLVGGSLLFFILTCFYVVRVLNSLDFYVFSSV